MDNKFRILTAVCLVLSGLATIFWALVSISNIAGAIPSSGEQTASSFLITIGLVSILCAAMLILFRKRYDVTVFVTILYILTVLAITAVLRWVVDEPDGFGLVTYQRYEVFILVALVSVNAYLSRPKKK